jgi:hypothetical protein
MKATLEKWPRLTLKCCNSDGPSESANEYHCFPRDKSFTVSGTGYFEGFQTRYINIHLVVPILLNALTSNLALLGNPISAPCSELVT